MKLYRSLCEGLKDQHEAVREIIASLSDPRLRSAPAPGKWSIHDNIAHLAKYQPIFLDRLHTILREEEPAFERYSAGDDPEFEEWRSRDTETLLDTLNTDRRRIFDLVSSLSEAELARTGIHPKFGRLTIIQWTEFFLLHEAHHLFTIFQLVHTGE